MQNLSLSRRLQQIQGNISYHTWSIPKPRGGKREISAPNDQLKEVQQELLDIMAEYFHPSEWSFAFSKGRSVSQCVSPHIGQPVIITMDLKNFFPSVPEELIRWTIQNLILPRLEPYPEAEEHCFKALTYNGVLPQGAPTSPLISNFVFDRRDSVLAEISEAHHMKYTRYADDLIFSTCRTERWTKEDVASFANWVGNVIKPFQINTNKIRFMHKDMRQQILGITVNKEATVSKDLRNSLRGYMHTLGIEGSLLDAETLGMLSYIRSINVRAYINLMDVYTKALRRKDGNSQATNFRSKDLPGGGPQGSKGSWNNDSRREILHQICSN